jgi:hypothetical protein
MTTTLLDSVALELRLYRLHLLYGWKENFFDRASKSGCVYSEIMGGCMCDRGLLELGGYRIRVGWTYSTLPSANVLYRASNPEELGIGDVSLSSPCFISTHF